MVANEYYFETQWRVSASIEEVSAILLEPLRLPDWWPSVYLDVKIAESGTVFLVTKGFLPYKLKWHFDVVESNPPYGFKLNAGGDFHGTGEWILGQDGESAHITYLWRIRADKPLLRHLSFVLKPLFAWNHRWAMEQGRICLEKELERRRLAIQTAIAS